MHAGGDGGGVEDELEEEGDEVDGDEDGGAAACGGGEEQDHRPGAEELDGEQATGCARQDGEALLEAEDDEENARCAEETDDLAAPPWVGGSAEIDGHHARNHGAQHQDGADAVNLQEALAQGYTRARVVLGEEEDPGGYKDASDAQVDVETPTPTGAAACESTCEKASAHLIIVTLLVHSPPIIGPRTVPRPHVRPVLFLVT